MTETADFAETLRKEATRPIAVAHQYRLDYYAASDEAIFLFFEGMDDKKYYLPLIERHRQNELVHTYICDGKRQTIQTWQILSGWNVIDVDRALFFLDADHDRYLKRRRFSKTNVFITRTYSFENYLVSAEAVQVVLSQYTPMNVADRRFRTALAEFGVAYEGFVRCMRPIMAWCIYVRSEGEKPNLSNVNLKNVVKIEEGGRVTRGQGGFPGFRSACGSESRVSNQGLKKLITRLRREPAKHWLRGKFELWFLQQFLNSVFDTLIKEGRAAGAGRRIRRPRALEGGDLVELLSGRVAYPRELTEFLKQHSLG